MDAMDALQEKLRSFAVDRGLLPNDKEWSEHGDMSFAEPPRLGAGQGIKDAIEDLRSDWRTEITDGPDPHDEATAKGFEKLLEILGPRVDSLFAQTYMSHGFPPELDQAFEKAGLDVQDIDYLVDHMESIYGPYGHIQNWIDAPPELRQEFHDLEEYTQKNPNWHETEEGQAKRERMRQIEDTIFPGDTAHARSVVRDLKLDDEE